MLRDTLMLVLGAWEGQRGLEKPSPRGSRRRVLLCRGGKLQAAWEKKEFTSAAWVGQAWGMLCGAGIWEGRDRAAWGVRITRGGSLHGALYNRRGRGVQLAAKFRVNLEVLWGHQQRNCPCLWPTGRIQALCYRELEWGSTPWAQTVYVSWIV